MSAYGYTQGGCVDCRYRLTQSLATWERERQYFHYCKFAPDVYGTEHAVRVLAEHHIAHKPADCPARLQQEAEEVVLRAVMHGQPEAVC